MSDCRSPFRRIGRPLLMTAAAVLIAGSVARADISFVDSFRNISYEQVGDGNNLTLNGTFYSADLTSVNPNDYNSVSMTYPGPGSPQDIPQVDSTTFHFQTGFLPDQAAMDAAYPMGTYSFTATNGIVTDMASYHYTADDYPQSLPYLTGSTYSALQGMNASQAFTFQFSPFVTGNNASASYMFLTIYDYTTKSFVFDAGFLSPTTTSLVLPANTLVAGHQYSYELDFSNRDLVPSPGAVSDAQLGFEVRTAGTFTTAVPEPSSALVAVVAGVVGLGVAARRRGCPLAA